MPTKHYLADDLDIVLAASRPLWENLRGARVLLTGGTGYVGCWLVELLLRADQCLDLGLTLHVMARNPARLTERMPHLIGHRALQLIAGDINAAQNIAGNWSHVIHAAAETNVALDNPSPMKMFDSSYQGTRNILELAARSGCERFLLISSGAVYGKQILRTTPISETTCFGSGSPYAEGKRAAEFLCREMAAENGFQSTIARCFAFSGPYLPLQSGFAFGNFVGAVLAGKPIVINGDGSPLRSYMYGADMALWLWTILLNGHQGQIVNVGSDLPVSIKELALSIGHTLAGSGSYEVSILGQPSQLPPEMYVPSVDLAKETLGLSLQFDLPHAIRQAAHWVRISEKY